MKKIILGVVIGVMLSCTAFAAGQTIEVAFNKINVTVDGKEAKAPNILYDGRTYIQLRDTAEILDKEVVWDGSTNTAEIKSKEKTEMESIERLLNSNSLNVSKSHKYLCLFDGEKYYLPLNAFVNYYSSTDTEHVINIPGKIELRLDKKNKQSSLVINRIGIIYIDLQAIGIKAELKDDTLWLE